jgi:hypothetical protein
VEDNEVVTIGRTPPASGRHLRFAERQELLMNVEFDSAQMVLLREILDSAFRDLRYEVADTNNSKYKEQLRERERALSELLDLVGGPLPDQ